MDYTDYTCLAQMGTSIRQKIKKAFLDLNKVQTDCKRRQKLRSDWRAITMNKE